MRLMRALRPWTGIGSLLVLAACAGTGTEAPQSAQGSSVPSPSASSPTPGTASDSAEPTPVPPPQPDGEDLGFGPHATVAVDGLRVRSWPGTSAVPVLTSLRTREEVVLQLGPLTLDGYRWYLVRFSPRDAGDFVGLNGGWVAGGPEGEQDPFLSMSATNCPSSTEVAILAVLQPLAFSGCGIGVEEVSGIVDSCFEGPITPLEYSPSWAWFSCLSVRQDMETPALPFHLPPDFSGPEPGRGDIVTIHGQLGFDTSRYGECTVSGGPDAEIVEILDAAQLIWATECQYRFVVTSLEITGHVDLAPLY